MQDPETRIVVPSGLGIVGHVALSGEVVNTKAPYDDPRFHPSERVAQRIRSALYVPIVDSSGGVRCVLLAVNKTGGVPPERPGDEGASGSTAGIEGFSEDDESVLRTVGGFVAAVLSRCSRRLNDPSDVAVLRVRELEVRRIIRA